MEKDFIVLVLHEKTGTTEAISASYVKASWIRPDSNGTFLEDLEWYYNAMADNVSGFSTYLYDMNVTFFDVNFTDVKNTGIDLGFNRST